MRQAVQDEFREVLNDPDREQKLTDFAERLMSLAA
jgi:hypothetical protein